MPETENIRQMYLKSHKDYDPAEQKKRPYNWPVEPTDFRFGQVAKNVIFKRLTVKTIKFAIYTLISRPATEYHLLGKSTFHCQICH